MYELLIYVWDAWSPIIAFILAIITLPMTYITICTMYVLRAICVSVVHICSRTARTWVIMKHRPLWKYNIHRRMRAKQQTAAKKNKIKGATEQKSTQTTYIVYQHLWSLCMSLSLSLMRRGYWHFDTARTFSHALRLHRYNIINLLAIHFSWYN